MLIAFGNIRTRAANYLRRELNYIYDVFYRFPAEPSRKRGFFTNVLNSITGLETKEHVNELKKMMVKVEKGILSATEAWKTGSSHFTAAIKLEKSRVDNLQYLLEIHKQSITTPQSSILETYRERNNMVRIMSLIIDSLTNLTLQISELDTILTATELLSKKQLPHVPINHTMLWQSLIYLQSHLNDVRTNLKLVHTDSAYYYKQAEFHVFRYKKQLIIRLHVLLTLRNLAKPFTIWKLNKIPLASPNQSNYIMLNANFKAIHYTPELDYYLVLNHLLDSEMQTLDINKQGIILQDRNIKTCPLTLLENDLTEIQTYCGYSVVDSPVPKAVYR